MSWCKTLDGCDAKESCVKTSCGPALADALIDIDRCSVDTVINIDLLGKFKDLKTIHAELFYSMMSVDDMCHFKFQKASFPATFLDKKPVSLMLDSICANGSVELKNLDQTTFCFYIYVLDRLNQLDNIVDMTLSGLLPKLPLRLFDKCKNLSSLNVIQLRFECIGDIYNKQFQASIIANSDHVHMFNRFFGSSKSYPNLKVTFESSDTIENVKMHSDTSNRQYNVSFDERSFLLPKSSYYQDSDKQDCLVCCQVS